MSLPKPDPLTPCAEGGGDPPEVATLPDVDVELFGPEGPQATFETETGEKVAVTATNRVSLVYYLASALLDDRSAPGSESGWRSNAQASIAVWGRAGRDDPRRLKSLVFNLRAELRAAGIDPWCIEKRRSSVRLRAHHHRQVDHFTLIGKATRSSLGGVAKVSPPSPLDSSPWVCSA
ncbi:MAG: hypothetical protein R3F59_04560 [Myxococcota bacterium]